MTYSPSIKGFDFRNIAAFLLLFSLGANAATGNEKDTTTENASLLDDNKDQKPTKVGPIPLLDRSKELFGELETTQTANRSVVGLFVLLGLYGTIRYGFGIVYSLFDKLSLKGIAKSFAYALMPFSGLMAYGASYTALNKLGAPRWLGAVVGLVIGIVVQYFAARRLYSKSKSTLQRDYLKSWKLWEARGSSLKKVCGALTVYLVELALALALIFYFLPLEPIKDGLSLDSVISFFGKSEK